MSSVIPEPLAELIESIGQLPGVGPRSAERYAYWLFKNPPAKSAQLSRDLKNLHSHITTCPMTFALISKEQAISPLYSDPRRDKTQVAVVAEPFDIVALEKTNAYRGTYHVLGGLVSPIEGIGPEQLKIKELLQRIKTDKVKEVILALNASVEGESTALLIVQGLPKAKLKVSRLAHGIPVGVDLEYADQLTLLKALEGRQAVS